MSNKLDAIAKLEKNPKEIYEAARRLLVKIADNILKEPHNEKLRILQKGNATIKTKILGAYGGLDCLLSMGFQEDDAFLKLPLDAPVSKIERVRSGILQDVNVESDEPSRGAVPKSSTSKVSMHAARSRLNDVDKILIDYVKERPPLWNTSLPTSQRTEEIQVALWQEIDDAIKNSNGDSRVHTISNTSALKKRWQLISKIYETSDVLSSAEKNVWKCTIDRCKFLNAEKTNEFANPPCRGLMQEGGVHKQFSAPLQELREVGHVDAEKSEFAAENGVNPVCVRLSEILDELPMVKRAKLEIEFLAVAYECLLNDEKQSTQTGQADKNAPGTEPSQEDVIKRVILPPFHSALTNPFLREIALRFHVAQFHDDKALQARARKLIPLQDLEEAAQDRLRAFQESIKKEDKGRVLEISLQDMLILELLSWFKCSFFSWVDSPPCEQCSGETKFSHMCTDRNLMVYTDRVEMHRCNRCNSLTPFARYNDLNILMETRRGRCGEWANTFTLFCRAMGWDARHVFDETDHVWTEVYSLAQGRWLHCDPCENACDTPLMYESGWNKEVSYVMAYSGEEVQDVTWRYTSHHKSVMQRRNKCGEEELITALMSLRRERQKNLSDARRKYLTGRLLGELSELMVERQPNERDQQERVSGSVAWKLSRGEARADARGHFVWKLVAGEREPVAVQYSAASDQYERTTDPNGSTETVDGWSAGVYESVGVFRKEEKDWKVAYLSRQEGVGEGKISWRFTVESAVRSFDLVHIRFNYALFENGRVDVTVANEHLKTVPFDHGMKSLVTRDFAGSKTITVSAVLTGGRGNVAWQHAQLFRQATNSEEYPFKVLFTFRKDV